MGSLLVLAGAFSIYLYSKDIKQAETINIKSFPRTVADWSSQDIPLSKDDFILLETDNAFFRKYKNPEGQTVYLYIVYSRTNHKTTHLPEICYRGNGVLIIEKSRDSIPVSYKRLTIDANRLLLQSGELYQISFYWFKAGEVFTPNYLKEQLLVAYNALFDKDKGSALIRISADVIDHDKDKAAREVKGFANVITPQLFKYLP